MNRQRVTNTRIVQLMPAVGWRAVYAEPGAENGTDWHSARVVAFALVDEWEAYDYQAGPSTGVKPERYIRPVAWMDGCLDVDDCINLIAIVHDDDWDSIQPYLNGRAAEYNAVLQADKVRADRKRDQQTSAPAAVPVDYERGVRRG
jgi:hypothetical protein